MDSLSSESERKESERNKSNFFNIIYICFIMKLQQNRVPGILKIVTMKISG